MNKYLWRGLLAIVLGMVGIYWGIQLMEQEEGWYKLALTLGVILFGVGFITLVYRLFRSIDRSTLLEKRKTQQKEK